MDFREHAHVSLISTYSDAQKLRNGSYQGGVSGNMLKSYHNLDLDQEKVVHSSLTDGAIHKKLPSLQGEIKLISISSILQLCRSIASR